MTLGDVLAPVRLRYASWMGLSAAEVEAEEEDPAQVRALQLVLRLERDAAPSRRRALELAASACALLCLADASAPGGPWHEAVDAYCRGRIRKVTRRARGAQWEAVADLPGLTLRDGETQVRALVPGLVSDLDKRVAKLQVAGTDIADDGTVPTRKPGESGPVLRCGVPSSRDLTAGKLMAQTGHAGMIAAALSADTDPDLLRDWHAAGCPARLEVVDQTRWEDLLGSLADPAAAWRDHHRLAVRDAGFTEVDPGTVTVVATLS